MVPEFQAQGGKTLQAAAGIRGKLFVSPRVSFYGLLLPGLLHFTHSGIGVVGPVTVVGGTTHFALDTGLGIEFYPTARWTARAEVTGPLYSAPGTVLVRQPTPNGDFTASVAGRFVNPWQLSTGIGLQQNTALGAFVSYRLAQSVYADGALNGFLRQAPNVTAFDGGYLLQALGGVKLGVRKDAYGIFAKTRVGVNSQSGAFREGHYPSPDASLPIVTTGRANVVAVDVGGVFERYVGPRLLVRFDGGDVASVFHATTIVENGVPMFFRAPVSTHSLQMTVGLGWRF